VNIRGIAILLSLSAGVSACGAKVVGLDASMIEASDEPDVLGIVHEKIEKLVVDDQRLYWVGTQHVVPIGSHYDWWLHSCQKRACASTIVTYDAQGSTNDIVFAVLGDRIYWHGPNIGQLASCPIEGCGGSPETLVPWVRFRSAAFDDEYFYYAVSSGRLNRLSFSQPGSVQPLSPKVDFASVYIHGDYVYLLALDPKSLKYQGILSLVRTRKDGTSSIELISDEVRASFVHHEFDVTADQSSIYWSDNLLVGSINRCPLTGCSGAPEVVLAPVRVPQTLLIDGSRLYYAYETKSGQNAVSSCALAACEPSLPLIEQLDSSGALAFDEQYLYAATTQQDADFHTGQGTVVRLIRVPKPDALLP